MPKPAIIPAGVVCVVCNGSNLHRAGCKAGKQRYGCKDCKAATGREVTFNGPPVDALDVPSTSATATAFTLPLCFETNEERKKREQKERSRLYYVQNKERIHERNRSYREQNKERIYQQNSLYRHRNKERVLEQKRMHWEQNKERYAAYKRLHYAQNRERILEAQYLYVQQNKERVKERKKLYREKNKERLCEYQSLYREKNKERLYESKRLYWEKNKERKAEHKQRRRARKRAVLVEKVDRTAIIQRDNSTCYLCGKHLEPSTITLDHVLPLARGGSHTMDNLRVACRSCNCRKKDRTLEEYLAWREKIESAGNMLTSVK